MRILLLLFTLFGPLQIFSDESKPPKTEEAQPSENEENQTIVRPTGDPPFSSESDYQKQFTKTLIAIVIIIAVAFLIIWILRRYSPARTLNTNARKNIKILERRHLSPNTYLYHVQIGDKQVIIAESKFHVTTVTTLDWNEDQSDI